MMNEHNERSQLSRIESYACMITQSDPNLMRESNMKDRMSMVGHATMLVLVTILAVLAWTAYWASFLPIWSAIPLGLLVGAFVFCFDQAIGASDWELAGVLRNSPYEMKWWGKLLLRIGVAYLLAQATSVGASMWLFRASIDNLLREERVQKLAPLEADYAQAKADLKNRFISPLESEMAATQSERETLNASLKASIATRNAAQQRASAARIEADREDKGGLNNYIKGKGPLYEEAKRQEGEAARILDAADFDEKLAHARIDTLSLRIDKLRVGLGAASKSFDEQAAKLDTTKTLDARWQSDESDPMMRYEALEKMKNSSERGKAASEITLLMTMTLMTFELMFLLVKVIFNHASVYTVRLISSTKQEAAEVSAEYHRKAEHIKRNRPHGNLHVVGGQPPNQNGEQQ